MWILHSPSFIAPVNKYFTQSGGPDASNTEKFQEILLHYLCYAETGTAATKGCSDENLWKSQLLQNQDQLLILHLSAIILLLEIKPIPIA
jgi:hypothetical protein